MVTNGSHLVTLVELVDRLPLLTSAPAVRGRPRVYSDRLFLKALVIMIVKRLPTVPLLLAVLDQPTLEMQQLQTLLREHDRYPSRRTFERRLAAIPATLPERWRRSPAHLPSTPLPCDRELQRPVQRDLRCTPARADTRTAGDASLRARCHPRLSTHRLAVLRGQSRPARRPQTLYQSGLRFTTRCDSS